MIHHRMPILHDPRRRRIAVERRRGEPELIRGTIEVVLADDGLDRVDCQDWRWGEEGEEEQRGQHCRYWWSEWMLSVAVQLRWAVQTVMFNGRAEPIHVVCSFESGSARLGDSYISSNYTSPRTLRYPLFSFLLLCCR